jgi:hypothetical protein
MATGHHRLTPRTPPVYDSRTHGRRESLVPSDDYTLNEGAVPINLVRARFETGPLVFIPFKHPDYSNPGEKLQPGRLSAAPGHYSHWCVRVHTANYIGMPDGPRFTFITSMPEDKIGRMNNPYRTFQQAAKAAHDAGEYGGKPWPGAWNKLFPKKQSKNNQELIPPTKAKFFLQGAVYANGDVNYMEQREVPFGLGLNDDLVVLQLNVSAGIELFHLFDTTKDSWDGDADEDFNLPFVYGDPTGTFLPKKRVVKDGWLITVFNPKVTKIRNPASTADVKPGDYVASSWDGKIADVQGYEVALSKSYVYGGAEYKARIDSEGVDRMFNRLQWWFDAKDTGEKGILRVAPLEQQALWVATGYKELARLVSWAWGETPQYLTDEVRGVLQSRVAASVPGAEDDNEDDEMPTRSGRNRVKDPTVRSKPQDEDDEEDEDEENEFEEDEDDEPAPKKGKKAKPAKAKARDEEDDEDDDEDDEPAPKKGKKAKPAKARDDDEDDEEDDEEPAPKKGKKAAKKPAKAEDDDEDEEDEEDEADEDDEEEEEEEPAPKKGKKVAAKAKKPVAEEDDEEEDDEDDEEEDDEETDEEDEEEDEPAPKKASKKPAPKVAKKPAKAQKVEDDEEDDEEDEEEDEEDEPAPKKAVKKPAAKVPAKSKADEDDDDYFAEDTPQKKSLKKAEAAESAKARSGKRATADVPPPSKGGSAAKKKK